jgi:cytochrome b pre-mRNA-processing protein 3
MRWFSETRRREREAAERIYAASVAAARRPELFLALGVPDTLQGRFEMVALHLFPVLHRLMHDPGDDPELARLVSERFVADMDAGFREMGVGDLSVPKRMNALYRSFAGRITAYKRGIEDGDEALLDAVARNIFPDGADDAHALALKVHLVAAVGAVRAADLDAVRRGDLPFPEPPLLGR